MDKHFMAKIMANINNFQRNVKKAQALAKTSIPDEIETDITANTSKFQRGLMRAKAMAQKWRSHDVEFKADTSQLMTKYGATRLSVEKWKEHTVNINANTNRFMRAIKGAKKSLIDLNKHEYRPNLGWVDKETNKLVKSTKYVEGRFTGMFSTIKRGWAQTQKAQNNFDNTMQSMAQSIRSFGTVFSNQIKGTLIASFQGLIPIIAGLVPAIMAVGNALKVVTGGALGLAGAIAIAAGGFVGFGAMAISAITMLNDGTLQATKETKKYQSALEGVKDTWADIIKSNQSEIFNTMANGLNAVKNAMKGLTPFLDGVASGMEKASKSLLQWTKSSTVAKAFFNMMETTGVSVFNKMLSAAGKFGDGLINVFTQLAPLFQWSANWLDRIATNFSKWANSASGKNSIKEFMEYTKQNLPLIGKIFGNTFAAINNLMKAFGSNSTNIFEALAQMTQKFRDWSETVGKSEGFKKFVDYVQQNGPKIMDLIGNLTMLLVNFGTAMAPIASKILDVVNAIVSFTSNLFAAHPGVAKLVGIMTILGGILLAVIPTIAQVAIFVKDLLIPFISWASKAGLVGKIMSGLGNVLKFVLKPINLLRAGLAALGPVGWIVIAVITALVGAITYLWKTNEGFRNAVTQAWQTISTTIGTAISGLISWFQELWSNIQTTLQPIMPLLQQLGTLANQILGVIFVAAIKALVLAFQFLSAQVQIAWSIVGTVISVAVQLVTGILTAFIQFLTGDFSGAWLTLQQTISNVGQTIWQGIQNIWSIIQNYFFQVYGNLVGKTITSWSQIWSIISGKLASILGSIIGYFSQILSSIIGYMAQVVANISSTWSNIVSTIISSLVSAYNSVISYMSQILASIASTMIGIVSRTISGMAEFVSSIISGVQNALSAVAEFAGEFISAGYDLIMGMVQGVKNAAGALVDAAVSAVSDAISAAKSKLKINSPSKVFAEIGMWTVMGMVKGIDKHKGSAVSSTERLANSITNAFSPQLVPSVDSSLMRDGISSAVGNIDGYIDSDVRHSIAENNRPVVNLVVKNEADVPLIKSTIEDMSAKEYYS